MSRFSSILFPAVLLAAILAYHPVYANVFASQLSTASTVDSAQGGTLHYLLNETADSGVQVQIIRESDGAVIRTLTGGAAPRD